MPLQDVSKQRLDQWRRRPIHPVLQQLGVAAQQAERLDCVAFRRLSAYLLEIADGRDRREAWVARTSAIRPVPKLRVLIDECFERYGDLEWFRLNKTANATRLPLLGLFPRVAASFSRIATGDVAAIVEALVGPSPDAALMAALHGRGGKIRGMGVELFSRIAFVFRPDLYFVIPREWGSASGCSKFIGNDLRKYLATCRTLRRVCDDLGFPAEIRATALEHQLGLEEVPEDLQRALDEAIGRSLARHQVLSASDGYRLDDDPSDGAAIPREFAARAIRARRGERDLRENLCRAYRNRCAISGDCPKDLLEVAYVATFPASGMHVPENAILLRCDLHTLWDLHLIGVDPAEGRVRVARRVGGSEYGRFDGGRLLPRQDGSRVSPAALRERWEIFQDQRGTPSATPDAAGAPRRHREDVGSQREPREEQLSPSDSHSGTVILES